MKRIWLAILFGLLTLLSQGQIPELGIEDLTPSYHPNKFPNFTSESHPEITEKINMALQLELLDHLPGEYAEHPFEKVGLDTLNWGPHVTFYNYEVYEGTGGVLSFVLEGTGVGAGAIDFWTHYNFDRQTGYRLHFDELFKPGVGDSILKRCGDIDRRRRNSALVALKAEREAAVEVEKDDYDLDFLNEQIYVYENLIMEEDAYLPFFFYVADDSIHLTLESWVPRNMSFHNDLIDYTISFAFTSLDRILSDYGRKILAGETHNFISSHPEGKIYKGLVHNMYPANIFINRIYDDGSVDMHFWYGYSKNPVEWDGEFIDDSLLMVEYLYYNEDEGRWIVGHTIEAKIHDGKRITGIRKPKYAKPDMVFELELF